MRHDGLVVPRGSTRPIAAIIAVLALAIGCLGGDTKTPFPEGLDPLEPENRAAFPASDDPADPYPERLSFEVGSTPDFDWVHARGYVDAPIDRVREALLDPPVVVDRRQVDRWSVVLDVEPEYPHSFRIHNEVDDIITVEFDMTWRLGDSDPESAEPGLFLARWQKTNGTTFIQILRGSLVVRPIDDQTTSLELIEHLRATSGSHDQLMSYMGDLHASIVARVNDQPLPTY